MKALLWIVQYVLLVIAGVTYVHYFLLIGAEKSLRRLVNRAPNGTTLAFLKREQANYKKWQTILFVAMVVIFTGSASITVYALDQHRLVWANLGLLLLAALNAGRLFTFTPARQDKSLQTIRNWYS